MKFQSTAFRVLLLISISATLVAGCGKSDTTGNAYELGMIELHRGNHAEAIKHLAVADSLEPGNVEILEALAELHYAIGEYEKSISYFDSIIRRDPSALTPQLRKAEAYLILGNTHSQADRAAHFHFQAEEQCRNILEIDPRHAEARFMLARVLNARGDVARAIEEAARAIEFDPELFDVYMLKAQLLITGDQLERAEAICRQAEQMIESRRAAALEKAANESQRIAINNQAQREQFQVKRAMGDLMRRRGRIGLAIEAVKEAVELALNRDEEKMVRATLGELYLMRELWSEAEEQARRIQEIDRRFTYANYLLGRVALALARKIPDPESQERADYLRRARIELQSLSGSGSADGLYWLAEAYRLSGGHRAQALSEYQKALNALDERNEGLRTRTHLAMADIFWRESSFEEAEQHCNEILKYRPQQADALMMLSRIYLATGRVGLARTLLNRVTEMEASASANQLLAQLLMAEGRPQQALEAAHRAVEVAGTADSHALHLRGILYLNQRKFPEAIADFETIVQHDPDYAPAYRELARAYHQSNQTDKAIELLTRYMQAQPARAEGAVFLAEIHEELGKPDEAIELYREARSRDAQYIPAYNVARVYISRGRIDDARRTYHELVDVARDNPAVKMQARINLLLANLVESDYEAAMAQMPELARLEQIDADTLELHRVTIHLGKGEYEQAREAAARIGGSEIDKREAIDQLIRSCEADPEAAEKILPLLAYSVLKRNEMRFQDSVNYLLEALEVMPDNILLRINLMHLYALLDEREQVRKHVDILQEQHPHLRVPYLFRAGLAEAGGHLDKAIAAYEKMIEVEGAPVETMLLLGRLHLVRRDFNKAIEIADRAIVAGKGNSDIVLLKAEAYRMLSETHSQNRERNRAEAERLLETLAGLEPSNIIAQRMLARVYISGGKFDDAIRICDTALQERRDDTSFHVIKSQALLRKGQVHQAAQVLHEALELNDTNPEIYINLARLYRASPQTINTAITILNSGIGRLPDELMLKIMMVDTLLTGGRIESAETQLAAIADSLDEIQFALLKSQVNYRKALVQETIAQKNAILDETVEMLQPLTQSENPALAYQANMQLGQIQHEGYANSSAAAMHFLKAVELVDGQPEPFSMLAPIFLQQNQLEQSRRTLVRLSEISRDSTNLGRLAIVQQLMGNLAGAETISSAARQLEPATDQRHILAANIRLQAGKIDEAVTIFSSSDHADQVLVSSYSRMARGIPREASLAPVDRQAVARSLNTGLFYTMSGWHTQAVPHYRDALDRLQKVFDQPAHARATIFARMTAANAMINAGGDMLEEAATLYRQVLAIEPQYPVAMIRLGNIHEMQGRISDAVESYKKAAEWDTENIDLLIRIATIHRVMVNLDEARSYLAQAVSLLPETPANAVRLSDLYFRHGETYELEGRVEEALREYLEAIRVAPQERATVRAYNNAAWHFATKPEPNLNRALDYAIRAKNLNPHMPEIRDTLGWVLYLRGDYNAARQEIQMAALHRGYRNNGIIQYHYAAVLVKLGENQRALELLENMSEWHFTEQHAAEKRAAQALLAELRGMTR